MHRSGKAGLFRTVEKTVSREEMEKEISSTAGETCGTPGSDRSKAPVFVLGSPRSGTTLLYHMLLSAGGFAIYRSETHAFNVLEAAYGDLSNRHNRKRLMKAWLGSKLFRLSNLDAQEIEARVMADCRNGGDFLRIVMGDITRKQKVDRWADCTPDHSLYVQRIKETIPDALIVHIIRDGRDVALSMDKQGWIRPLPGDRKEHLMVSSLYWEWVVNRGREAGGKLEGDYYEVHFEDLLQNPRSVLAGLGAFIEHDLNYDRILEVGIGSVREPNSSFQAGASGNNFNPVGRWKDILSEEDATKMEGMIGGTLRELGYPLDGAQLSKSEWAKLRRMRSRYRSYFDFKFWLKTRALVGKWFVSKNLSWLETSPEP